MKIGTKIRQLRDLKGYSQEALAQEMEISQKQLSRYETDETSPTLETVEKIARALEINIRELLDFDSSKIFNNNVTNQQGGDYYNQQGVEFIAIKNSDLEYVKELHDKLIEEKDNVIELLKHEIEVMKALKTD